MIMDGGGPQVMYYPPSMRVGFGTFDYVDAYSPCNVVIGDPEDTTCQFPSPDGGLTGPLQTGLLNPRDGITGATYFNDPSSIQSRIWGQTVVMFINYVEVTTCGDSQPSKRRIG